MSNRTETPAPSMPERLRVVGTNDDAPIGIRNAILDENNQHRAYCIRSDDASELVRRYNAHAALVAACRWALGQAEYPLYDGTDADYARQYEAARSALAAAEGGAA